MCVSLSFVGLFFLFLFFLRGWGGVGVDYNQHSWYGYWNFTNGTENILQILDQGLQIICESRSGTSALP